MESLQDPIYSGVLVGALGAAAAGGVLFVLHLVSGPPGAARRLRWIAALGALAALLAVVSALVHWGFGHRPGTPSGQEAGLFLRSHRANVSVTLAGLALLAGALAKLRR